MTTLMQLGRVCEINPRLATKPNPSDRVSFLGMADVSEDGTTGAGHERLYKEVQKGFTNFLNGDLLMAKITPCFQNGKIAEASIEHEQGFGSTEFHVIRPNVGEIDRRYLLHFLRLPNLRVDGERRMTGSGGQRRVPTEFLRELKVPLPPVPEQRRIAAILDHADALRSKRREAIACLDKLRITVFDEMFGDPTENERGWPTTALNDVFERIVAGRNLVGNSDAVDGYQVLKVSAVTSLTYKECERKPLPSEYSPPSDHFVGVGDLLFSRANTSELVGATALVESTDGKTVLPDKLWRLQLAPDYEQSPLFLSTLMQGNSFRRKVSDFATGSSGSMKNISKAKLCSIQVGMPPKSDRLEFDHACSNILAELRTAKFHLEVLNNLFDSIQSRAFRGEV